MPDNLRSGVAKAHRYEPDVNPSYLDLAEHHRVACALPKTQGRSRRASGRTLDPGGAAQPCQFFSLDEINTAIALLLDRLNHKPFKKLPGSRRSAFKAINQPALQALPEHS